jgi:hypothetical protein
MSEAAARRLYCSRCLNTFEADHEQCPNLSCRRKRPTRGWGVIFAEGDIFDRNYRIHGSGIDAPGFNASLGARLTF